MKPANGNIDGVALLHGALGDFLVPEDSDLHAEATETRGQARAGLAMLTPWLQRGDTIVDLGAGVGMLAVPLQHLVGSVGRVWCFEPDARQFALLRWNLALNGLDLLARAVPGDSWPALDAWREATSVDSIAAIRIHGPAAASSLAREGLGTLRTDRPVILLTRAFGPPRDADPVQPLQRELLSLGYEFPRLSEAGEPLIGAPERAAANPNAGPTDGSVLAVPSPDPRRRAHSE